MDRMDVCWTKEDNGDLKDEIVVRINAVEDAEGGQSDTDRCGLAGR